MKKELFAGLTIVLFILLSLCHIVYLNHFIGELNQHIESSAQAYTAGNYALAGHQLNLALTQWQAADAYTHVMIRHSEIDTTNDAFREAIAAVQSEDSPAAQAALSILQYHLNEIQAMERLTLHSLF